MDARVEPDFVRQVVAEGKRKPDHDEDLVELGMCKVKTCKDQRIDTGRELRTHLGKACVVVLHNRLL